jgi:hypothetical protein
MAFAQALGVGCFSSGEYMEISLDDSAAPCDAAKVLNDSLPEGIRITGAWRMPESFPSLMAAVTAARWLVDFDSLVDETLAGKFSSLLGRENIVVEKEGKSGTSTVDIRPGIYSIELSTWPGPWISPLSLRRYPLLLRAGGELGTEAKPSPSNTPLPQDGGGVGERAGGIELLLAAGSKLNIRPELVVKAALGNEEKAKAITRLELYSTGNERHVPLYKFFDTGDF